MSLKSFISHVLHPSSVDRVTDAGHVVGTIAQSAVSHLWAEVKLAFPALVADIQKGIADVNDHSISGGEKAVRVALDVLATAPDVLKALPNAKAFFVHAVTDTFAAGLVDLEHAAADLIGTLGK